VRYHLRLPVSPFLKPGKACCRAVGEGYVYQKLGVCVVRFPYDSTCLESDFVSWYLESDSVS
jgi:hypothetical protein